MLVMMSSEVNSLVKMPFGDLGRASVISFSFSINVLFFLGYNNHIIKMV